MSNTVNAARKIRPPLMPRSTGSIAAKSAITASSNPISDSALPIVKSKPWLGRMRLKMRSP
jgi:hypothetical protein